MDRSTPLWRLLPWGVLSAAGLAGCASAPAYRPVTTSATPPNPVVASQSVTAPPAVSAAPTASPSGAVDPSLAPPADPMVAPSAPAGPPRAAAPLAAPLTVPAPSGMPAPPVSETAPPSSSVELAPAVTEPHLSAPMGVLQTPLPSPPLPSPLLPAPPIVVQPTEPGRLSPPAPAESVAPGVPATTNAAPKPAGKKVAAKPADPSPSPLARLRQRFHTLTHPAPKPTKKADALANGDPATAKATVAVATGPRVPIPTASEGVAVRVEKPPLHPLYASDEVENTPSNPPTTETAQIAPARPVDSPPLAPPATPASASGNEIEQWPNRADAPPSEQPVTSKDENFEDFTAVSPEEYRATVAKISPADGGPAILDKSKTPADVPTPAHEQARAAQPTTPQVPTVPAAAQSANRDTNSPLIVVPQAAHHATIPTDRVSPGGQVAPSDSFAARNVDVPRDPATAAPTSAAWSSATVPAQAIQTTAAGVTPNAGFAHPPGWTSVPAPVELPPALNSQSSAAPTAAPPTVSGRYGQPVWMQPRGNSASAGGPAVNPQPQPSALRELATP